MLRQPIAGPPPPARLPTTCAAATSATGPSVAVRQAVHARHCTAQRRAGCTAEGDATASPRLTGHAHTARRSMTQAGITCWDSAGSPAAVVRVRGTPGAPCWDGCTGVACAWPLMMQLLMGAVMHGHALRALLPLLAVAATVMAINMHAPHGQTCCSWQGSSRTAQAAHVQATKKPDIPYRHLRMQLQYTWSESSHPLPAHSRTVCGCVCPCSHQPDNAVHRVLGGGPTTLKAVGAARALNVHIPGPRT
jgi:hypothetical protein